MSNQLRPTIELQGDSHWIDSGDLNLCQSFEVTSHDGVSYSAFATVYVDFTFHIPREYELEGDAALAYVEERVEIVRRFLESNFDVDISGADSGVFHLEFYASVKLSEGATEEDAVNAVWEHSDLVKFTNEMDPGTFNAPYTGGLLTDLFRDYDNASGAEVRAA